ncbi:MAG: aminopeptidase P family protein [Sandaracinaceae bacterium]|nr:aminopeptidase P family protein [Sandaracinaceae bacterium]MDW8245097.1 aminopeptidase P family protein [Sandaracinaceae bacterium]
MPSLQHTFLKRRQSLASKLRSPALIFAGHAPPRNFPANTYPFRASSHFLYLVGMSIEGAAILVHPDGSSTLFVPTPSPDDELWHGPSPSLETISSLLGIEAQPFEGLKGSFRKEAIASLPVHDEKTRLIQQELIGRIVSASSLSPIDEALADAIISLRLHHDEAAIAEVRHAASITKQAHLEAMRSTRVGRGAWEIRATLLALFAHNHCTPAYEPIVTPKGEILHARDSNHILEEGDLLLIDAGAESPTGWASDVTRTIPVSGRFSSTQRAVYELVLEAQKGAISALRPGVRFRDVHLLASRILAEGLLELGILRNGGPETLIEEGALALFFPHGLGHLLGLDVHDMEDLGDRAGYAPGRFRSTHPSLRYLRLDRDLEAGMVVTIEPGFYHSKGWLAHPQNAPLVHRFVNVDILNRFSDVRGIRIEDDLLITQDGAECLTDSIPKEVEDIEKVIGGTC